MMDSKFDQWMSSNRAGRVLPPPPLLLLSSDFRAVDLISAAFLPRVSAVNCSKSKE